MAERLEVRLHGEQVGWVTRGSRRDRIEFEWVAGYEPGPVTFRVVWCYPGGGAVGRCEQLLRRIRT